MCDNAFVEGGNVIVKLLFSVFEVLLNVSKSLMFFSVSGRSGVFSFNDFLIVVLDVVKIVLDLGLAPVKENFVKFISAL